MKRTAMNFSGIALALVLLPCTALAFDSGSTGADGDFNPPVSIEVELPPNGILNYRSINISSGVIVTFKRNATNTPVVMLAQEDVLIAGTIDVSGKHAPPVGSEGDGNLADDGYPGIGGPGGYDGGHGGSAGGQPNGGSGLGPGAGSGSTGVVYQNQNPGSAAFGTPPPPNGMPHGSVYGSPLLLPLIGGSGGGGGFALVSRGVGGGGGGGAILIAGSGSVTISGKILAVGGNSHRPSVVFPGTTQLSGGFGGAGSGGAIRIAASRLIVSGVIAAYGGSSYGASGGSGRIRFEADTFGSVMATSPTASSGAPNPIFLIGSPTLRFATVDGIPVPANPTGFGDVAVPATTANPVTITLATSGIPVGSTVKVSVLPRSGTPVSMDSPPTVGSLDNATTSVSIDIPFGNNVLSAQTSYTVVAAVGDALSRFAQGERVEKVTLTSTLGQGDKATLHTVAGRQFEVEPALLKLAALLQ